MSIERSELKVLVVDDSDFSRSIISQMVNEAGFQVVGEAPGADVALAMVREKAPHVVITDIVMPNVSGIELTEKLSKDFDEIGVIVVSSLSQEHIVLEAIGAGARDFIAKPISPEQLTESLDKLRSEIEA